MGSAQFHLISAAFSHTILLPPSSAWPLPPEKLEEVARRYESGETQAAIAGALGVDRAVVRRVLDRLGVVRHTPCPRSGRHRIAILMAHDEGESITEISARVGLSFATVYRVLRRAGRVGKKRR